MDFQYIVFCFQITKQSFAGLNLAEQGNQKQWTDVQKKIIPWKDNSSDLDELVLQDRATKLGKSNSKLIVVASLVDKPTNLGGMILPSLYNQYLFLSFVWYLLKSNKCVSGFNSENNLRFSDGNRYLHICV